MPWLVVAVAAAEVAAAVWPAAAEAEAVVARVAAAVVVVAAAAWRGVVAVVAWVAAVVAAVEAVAAGAAASGSRGSGPASAIIRGRAPACGATTDRVVHAVTVKRPAAFAAGFFFVRVHLCPRSLRVSCVSGVRNAGPNQRAKDKL
jgi:hypothetical protein